MSGLHRSMTALATKCLKIATNICGYWVGNLLRFSPADHVMGHRSLVALATKFLEVATNVCGYSIRNLLSSSLLATIILSLFLDYSKIRRRCFIILYKKMCQIWYRQLPIKMAPQLIMFMDQLLFLRIGHPAVTYKIRQRGRLACYSYSCCVFQFKWKSSGTC
jgi:hypothetical protein